MFAASFRVCLRAVATSVTLVASLVPVVLSLLSSISALESKAVKNVTPPKDRDNSKVS